MAVPGKNMPMTLDKEAVFAMAQSEMEYRVGMFNGMVSTCFDKCHDRKHKDGELNIGENSCIDRCCAKYWQVTGIVGQMLGVTRSGQ